MKKLLRYHLPILLILVLALILRLYRIGDYIVFLGDEGRDALTVYNILHGHLTLLGPTASVGGFFLGPIYYYFMAPFLWLSHYDPAGPAVMVALFGVATVFLLYKIVDEFFDKKTALISSFLFSIAPTVLIYSRSSWNPNLMPFFTLLTLYAFYKALIKNNLILFTFSGFLFGILMQLHYLATFVGVVLAIFFFSYYLLQEKKELSLITRNILASLTGFIVGFSPFLAFEFRHGFKNTQSVIDFIFHSKDTGASFLFFSNIWQVASRLFTGILLGFPMPNQYHMFDPKFLNIWFLLGILIGAVSLSLFAKISRESLPDKNKKYFYMLIAIWFLVSLILFGLYKRSIYDYYLGFMFPLPFIFVGASLSYILKLNKKLLPVVLTIIVAVIFFQLQLNPLRFPPNKQFQATKKVAEFVLSQTNGMPFNFALISGGNSDFAYKYIFKLEGRDPVQIQNQYIDPDRKSTTSQLLIVCESLPCSPQGVSLWDVAGFDPFGEIVGHWRLSSVAEVYKLVHPNGIPTHIK